MKKFLKVSLSVLLLASCASIGTTKVKKEQKSTDGFYYTLPKNHINVEFTLKKITQTEGKNHEFACLLGLKDDEIFNGDPKVTYSIKSVEITPITHLDSRHVYQLKINQKFLNKTNFSIEYARNGELTSSSNSSESQVIPAITTLVNTVSGLSSGGLFLSEDSEEPICETPEITKDIRTKIDNIADIDSKITGLLGGIADVEMTKELLEYRLIKLNEIKNGLIGDFMGKKKIEIKKFSFEINPEELIDIQKGENTDKKEVITYKELILFKFDKKLGVERVRVANINNENQQIIEDLPFKSKESLADDSQKVSIKIDFVDRHVSNEINKFNGNPEVGGFFYRIPSQTSFKVMNGNKNLKTIRMPIPQFGTVAAAPANLNKLTFKLYPGLGSIYTVSGKTDSLKTGELNEFSKSLIQDTLDSKDKLIKGLEKDIKIKELREKLSTEAVDDNEEEDSEEESENL
mgnify:CR=1 FL=1|tara:strand:+ start:1096 stop:2478 length:1383 start_codon:yes stop_codon:yes gene_type:complete